MKITTDYRLVHRMASENTSDEKMFVECPTLVLLLESA